MNIKESNRKVLNIVLGILCGILLAVATLFGVSYLKLSKQEPKEKIVTVETIPDDYHGFLHVTAADSNLIDEDTYFKIDGVNYQFDLSWGTHDLVCHKLLKGNEVIEIKTHIACKYTIVQTKGMPSEGTVVFDSGFDNVDTYTFTTVADYNYYININQPMN